MLAGHLRESADIIGITRDVSTRHKEEVESVIHSGVPTLRLHHKPSYTPEQSNITQISKKQYVFLFVEDVAVKGNYILHKGNKYKIDGVEEMTMYSGSTQYRAICDEIE